MDYVIKTEELSKTYGSWFWKKKTPALDSLNLAIPKGTVFGFLGPNGAGKTTTIRLLMDLIKPTHGRAWVLGCPTDNIKVKHKIGFLPDAPAFSTYLTANEFLTICAKLLKIPSSQRKQRIEEVLDTVKMTEHAKSKLGGFSRGMIQRIGIAQAILNKPELMILDEPLLGLDPYGRQELKNIITAQKNSGTNVFFSSHILSDVEKICDHVGILSRGKMLCSGRLDELLSETGVRVNLASGNEELAKGLLGDASSSSRLSDGGWEMIFNATPETKGKLEAARVKAPNALTLTPSRESLEDFFFRKVESASKTV